MPDESPPAGDIVLAELRQLDGPLLDRIERSGAAFVVTDPRQRNNPVVHVNAVFCELTGYRADEILNRNCRLLQGQETDSDTISTIRVAIAERRPFRCELLNYRKDGSVFWNGVEIEPVAGLTGSTALFVATMRDVTAARRFGAFDPSAQQQELGELQAKLRVSRFTSGAAAAWEWHIEEERIIGDARFSALYGFTGEQAARGALPSSFFSIIHPQDQTRVRLAVGAMLRGAEVFSKEYRLLLGDGNVRWVQGRGRCHYDNHDLPTRFNGTLIDITEQRRVEEQLRIAQTAGGVGTFEYVDGYATVSVSEQFCRVVGLHAARDLPVRSINRLVAPGDPLIIDVTARADRGGVRHSELRVTRADDGQVRWLARRGEYICDTETADRRFVGVIYDVTDAKRTEEQLRTLNETLETRVEERTRERDRIWRLSSDLYVECDREGRCRSTNPAWGRELGMADEAICGRHLSDVVHPDDRAAMVSALERLAAGDLVRNFDTRIVGRDGEVRWFSWTCAAEDDALLAAGRDITDRNELEEQLRQSQKMEAVGQLTGGIAHDFNNMLTGIIGSLDLVRRRLTQGRSAEADRFIDAASGAAQRAAALVHRLLAFSRRQSLDVRALDVNRLVSSMEDLLRRTIGERVDLRLLLDDALWPGLSDGNQLESALLNLVINARDAMPGGGVLTVRTANTALGIDYTRHQKDLLPGDYVLIAVSDTGTGIAPEIADRVFDPFFTTKPLGLGTGLGLSMIYGFTKQSGGHVRLESEPGRGTTVSLYIPRFAGDMAEQTVASADEPVPGASGEHILVVEDDPSVRLFVTDALTELGYRLAEASDGAAALPILQSAQPIDLILTDVGLPGMTGRELAEVARAHRPGVKILFMTGYAEAAAVRSRFLGEGMDMVAKPFTVDALALKVQEMLR